MTLVVGADEAGYGPNLGPLVVATTVWEIDVPPATAGPRLDSAIAAAVAAEAAGARPLQWADSKRVHRGGGGFRDLESAALAGVAVASETVPTSWPLLVAQLDAGGGNGAAPEAPLRTTLRLPLEAGMADALQSRAAALRRGLAARGARLVAVRCRVVEPAAFNALLATGLNKSDLLSRVTLGLVAAALDGAGAAVVCCDRHGGRKRYAPLLTRHFEAPLVRVDEETSERSAYTIPDRDWQIEFLVRAEARPQVALASLVAKYLRELAMRAFNAHWQGIAPGVSATAGYPVDAARWRREVSAAVERAGVAWSDVWRQA